MTARDMLFSIGLVFAGLIVSCLCREVRRFVASFNALAEVEPEQDTTLRLPPQVPPPPEIEIDLVKDHRIALIDGFIRGSGQMLDAHDPRWKRINDLGIRMLDIYMQEYPYDPAHPIIIDHMTINAALHSQRRTITEA